MRSHELTIGRTFAVNFDHGDDFFTALADFCRERDIRCGYIPMFIAGFSEAEIVGTCKRVDDPGAPVWDSVYLTGVEVLGCGTIAYDSETDGILPHIHASLGEKARAANACTSHLQNARVQFLTEMLVVEVVSPLMTRPVNLNMYNVPLLAFDQ